MSTEHTPDPIASPPVGLTQRPDAVAEARACGCWSRRESLLVAGVAVAGTAGLTACGAADDVESVADAASSVASAAAGAIQAAEIPVGGGKVFEAIKVVVTQPTSGEFKAFSAVCTHQACTVDSVSNGVIKCPCHGSEYDIATGEVRKGPATKALPAKSVTVGTEGISVS